MTSRSRQASAGFTLLEVLVASLIMAVAVTGVLAALSTSMRNAARLTDHDRAIQLARQKMDELLLAEKLPQGQVLQGTWDPSLTGGRQMIWRARITTFERAPGAGAGAPSLQRVQLLIAWTEGSQPRSYTLDGYRRGLTSEADVASGAGN